MLTRYRLFVVFVGARFELKLHCFIAGFFLGGVFALSAAAAKGAAFLAAARRRSSRSDFGDIEQDIHFIGFGHVSPMDGGVPRFPSRFNKLDLCRTYQGPSRTSDRASF
jgi:hypothetical protein